MMDRTQTLLVAILVLGLGFPKKKDFDEFAHKTNPQKRTHKNNSRHHHQHHVCFSTTTTTLKERDALKGDDDDDIAKWCRATRVLVLVFLKV